MKCLYAILLALKMGGWIPHTYTIVWERDNKPCQEYTVEWEMQVGKERVERRLESAFRGKGENESPEVCYQVAVVPNFSQGYNRIRVLDGPIPKEFVLYRGDSGKIIFESSQGEPV